ncbi:hypothetical protein NL676_007243 [Syzygium grande]|nr:hypothetical protein NL676_007243 [Syzygium grande]
MPAGPTTASPSPPPVAGLFAAPMTAPDDLSAPTTPPLLRPPSSPVPSASTSTPGRHPSLAPQGPSSRLPPLLFSTFLSPRPEKSPRR